MPRKKNKAKLKAKHAAKPSGSAKSTPQRTPARSQPWNAAATDAAPAFSLRDEARWMSGHRTAAFEAGKQLRHMPIAFISAGCLQGTLEDKKPVAPADSPNDADSNADDHDNDDDYDGYDGASAASPPAPSSSPPPDNTAAMADMAIRSPSPAPSHSSSGSSADVVVFRGRGHSPLPTAATSRRESPSPSKHAVAHAAPSSTVQADASVGLSIRVKASDSTAPTKPEPESESQYDADADADDVVQDHFAKRRGDKPEWEGTTTPWVHRSKPGIGWLPVEDRPDMDAFLDDDVDPRDAAMDDYMQNIDEFGLTGDMLKASGFARREMDLDAGSHNDWESASGSQAGDDDDSWDSEMIQDFADMSTSSDVMDTVVRILSKRTRKNGLQYLCVYEGSVTDDARWLPATYLKRSTERDLIRIFEDEHRRRELAQLDGSDSTDKDEVGGDSEDDDDDGDDDGDDDEELDDETIARVLQKQEELGLGSDELVLYAADEYFGGSTRADDFSMNDFIPFSKKGRNRGRGKREMAFPSASAMADALDMDPYSGFDIMDTDRPSLRPKKKGRRGQMPPELDDSDLNEQLQNAWEADRSKKRIKKAEREQLRQQGLLGRKGKAPNLSVKYKDGISMEDVVEEIREFMMGDMQSLSLPPMDASRRATIHEAASFFKLTSRSRGDGLSRFTLLSKTSRTQIFTDSEFDRALLHKGLNRRLQGPLQSQKGARFAKTTTFRHGGARGRPQTGYQDGETVGANAPELGPENKGHALLSKMGWSKGMGLGALDNKGILQPIPHTVKMTKAGLQ